MRPGLVFIGLFAMLIAVYALLSDSIGAGPTFLLQAVIVVVLLIAALWLRRTAASRRASAQPDTDNDGSGEQEPPNAEDAS